MIDFPTAVIEASQASPILAFFHATWCPHCRRLAPVLASLAERSNVPLVAIDVDEEAALAQDQGVISFPYVRLWHHGREVARFTGERPPAEVEQWLREHAGAPA